MFFFNVGLYFMQTQKYNAQMQMHIKKSICAFVILILQAPNLSYPIWLYR